jgi:hypothetical protein
VAAGQGEVACTAVLIQAGADISKVTDYDETPLDCAHDCSLPKESAVIAKLLQEAERNLRRVRIGV